jgi:hypothetical protein
MSEAGSRRDPASDQPAAADQGREGGSAAPQYIGLHRVEVQGDTIHIVFLGPYKPEEARQVLTLADGLYRRYGGVYLLADVRRNGPPGPETRRMIATWPYLGSYVAALYGASTAVRVMTTLMLSAQRLIRSPQPIITELFEREDQARAWLAEQRQKQTRSRAG